jgi:hypothetical protein
LNWYKISSSEKLNKQFIGNTHSPGHKDNLKVFFVNGNYVRDNFETDFVLGSNSCADNFIPDGEVWIEKSDTSLHDIVSIIAHEISEYYEMKYKHLPYEKAHQIALNIEKNVREKTPENI